MKELHLKISSLVCLALVSCVKNQDQPEPTPTPDPIHNEWSTQPVIATGEQQYITLITNLKKGDKITFKTQTTNGWVDLNNNGTKDATDGSTANQQYTVNAPVITFYGNFSDFQISGNQLTHIDVSHAPKLKNLNLSHNRLSTKALLDLVKTLPMRPPTESPSEIVLQTFAEPNPDGNTLTTEVLQAIANKGWTAYYISGAEQQVAYNGKLVTIPQNNYQLSIGYKDVTHSNYTQLMDNKVFPAVKSGTVKYDPVNRVLLLRNAVIETSSYNDTPLLLDASPSFTIIIEGNNTLRNNDPNSESNVVFTYRADDKAKTPELIFTGSGKLTLEAKEETIRSDRTNLTFDGGCQIESLGDIESMGNQAAGGGYITFKRVKIHAKGSKKYGAIIAHMGINYPQEASVSTIPATATLTWNEDYYTYFHSETAGVTPKPCSEITVEVK